MNKLVEKHASFQLFISNEFFKKMGKIYPQFINMDRINEFINRRPTKKTRHIKYKNEYVKITKSDVKKIRKYKSNNCLDPTFTLQRYNNTKWSNTKDFNGIEKIKKDFYGKKKAVEFIQTQLKYKGPRKDTRNEIRDLWEGQDVFCFNNDTDRVCFDSKNMFIDKLDCSVGQLASEMNNILYNSFKIDIDPTQLIPKIPDIGQHDLKYELALCKTFPKVVDFYIHTGKHEFIYIENNLIAYNDFLNTKTYNLNFKTSFLNSFHITSNSISLYIGCYVLVYSTKVKNDYDLLNYINFESNQCNFNDYKSLDDIDDNEVNKEFNEIIAQNFTFNGKKLQLTHLIKNKTKIIKFVQSPEMSYFAFVSNKNLQLIDLKKKMGSTIMKFKSEHIIDIKFDNNTLYVSTTNNFIIYDVMNKNIKKDFQGIFTYVHCFDANNKLVICAERKTRLTIIYKNSIIKHLEQIKPIHNVVIHKKQPYFIVTFEDEMWLYYGKFNKINNQFECKILQKWKGKYKNVYFNEFTHWIYASIDNKVLLYT